MSWTPEYTARYQAKKRAWLDAAKLEQGCVDCGFDSDAAKLSFHHRDPSTKLFNVGTKLHCHGYVALRLEIAKCDVVCEPCHIARHRAA